VKFGLGAAVPKGPKEKQHALPYFVASGIQLGGLLDWVRAQALHILLLFIYVLRFLATFFEIIRLTRS
jgi:hypothetical protein